VCLILLARVIEIDDKKKEKEKRLNLKRYLNKKKGRNDLVFDGKMKTKISQ
jgi:hypothetical protein